MRSLETVVELFGLATQDMMWGGAPPTRRSVKRIREILGVRIPDAYLQVAAACPNYGAYLNGIGEDYDHDVHMLRLTQWFRSASVPPLPSHYVLLSHGHDGDCDCWDTREVEASGEHPIVHVSLETGYGDAPPQVQITDIRYASFASYLRSITIHYAERLRYPGCDPARQARATELIGNLNREHEGTS